MSVGSRYEMEALAAAGRAAARALSAMLSAVEPGVTPLALDAIGAASLRASGARSAPMLTVGFPNATCISVNEAVAHGVPDARPLRDGDLVNMDVSVELDGFFADTGASVPVGDAPASLHRLCDAGRQALSRALDQVRPGAFLSHVGRAAERVARASGYRIIRDLYGHGVGRALWEDPTEIPSWFDPRDQRRLEEGMVLAIEPFLCSGAGQVEVDPDGWTLRTVDGSLAVQNEHTVVVTDAGAVVVTAEAPLLHAGLGLPA